MSEPRYDLVPRELLDSVVRHLRPQRIILFGSRARGDAREDSDIDLLVVVDDDLPPGALAGRTLLDACGNYDGAVDIVPFRRRNFTDDLRYVGSLPWIAEYEGIEVYAAAHAQV